MESHEPRDFNVRRVLWTAFGLICLLAVVALSAFLRQRSLTKNFDQVDVPPKSSPRLQAEFETGELQKALYDQQNQKLNDYGWVDAEKTWARVSYETAARLVLSKQSTDPQVLFQAQKKGVRP